MKRKRFFIEGLDQEKRGRLPTGKREEIVVSTDQHEKIKKENARIIAISMVVLFGITMSIGVLFEVHPSVTTARASPNTIYYGNEWMVNYSSYDIYGLWLGEVYTTWTFAYNTNGGYFVTNGNTFFHDSITPAWFTSASINGQSSTTSTTELHATVDFTISGTSGTLVSKVVSAGNNLVGVYGYLVGSSSTETYIVVPFDE